MAKKVWDDLLQGKRMCDSSVSPTVLAFRASGQYRLYSSSPSCLTKDRRHTLLRTYHGMRFKGLICRSSWQSSGLKTKLRRFYASSSHHDPLRILFCGSDEFSIASLNALQRETVESASRIASIDVLCRPGKPTGRGLKFIREGTPTNAYRTSSAPLTIHDSADRCCCSESGPTAT